MNAIKNFFSRFFPTVTVAEAIADLDRAVAKLDKAEAHHNALTDKHAYAAEVSSKLASDHEYAAVRAVRVRSKLVELLA